MIDLRKALPDSLEVDGRAYRIDTCFRTWIRWIEQVQTDETAGLYIFTGEVPEGFGWIRAAMDFYESPTLTPRQGKETAARTLDYIEDGERIVAAFQQAYGIDLTDPDCKMHWHRFKALLGNLPESTQLSKVMGYRSWKRPKENDKGAYERGMDEMRRAYELPRKMTGRERHIIELQERAFGKLRP